MYFLSCLVLWYIIGFGSIFTIVLFEHKWDIQEEYDVGVIGFLCFASCFGPIVPIIILGVLCVEGNEKFNKYVNDRMTALLDVLTRK